MSVRHRAPTTSDILTAHAIMAESDDLQIANATNSPAAEPTEGGKAKRKWVPRSEKAKASRRTAAREAFAQESRIPRLFTQQEAKVSHVALLFFCCPIRQ